MASSVRIGPAVCGASGLALVALGARHDRLAALADLAGHTPTLGNSAFRLGLLFARIRARNHGVFGGRRRDMGFVGHGWFLLIPLSRRGPVRRLDPRRRLGATRDTSSSFAAPWLRCPRAQSGMRPRPS